MDWVDEMCVTCAYFFVPFDRIPDEKRPRSNAMCVCGLTREAHHPKHPHIGLRNECDGFEMDFLAPAALLQLYRDLA
jgi:hypothetical protein